MNGDYFIIFKTPKAMLTDDWLKMLRNSRIKDNGQFRVPSLENVKKYHSHFAVFQIQFFQFFHVLLGIPGEISQKKCGPVYRSLFNENVLSRSGTLSVLYYCLFATNAPSELNGSQSG